MTDDSLTPEIPAENTESAAWAALVDADPAATLYVDLAKVRASVDTGVVSIATVTPLHKRSWFKPAAAAASVALLMGTASGYSIAALGESDEMPAVYLDANGAGSIPGRAETSQTESLAAAGDLGLERSGKYAASSSAIWPGYGGRPFLEPTSQLSDDSSKQVGYTLDASDVDRKSEVKKLADVFNITGKVTGNKKDGFTIGDQNWVKPVVQMSGSSFDKLASWNYSNQSVAPQFCGEDKNGQTFGLSSDCDKPSGVKITSDDAIAVAQEIFAQLGLAAEQAEWSASDATLMWGPQSVGQDPWGFFTVNANVLIDGKTSGMIWQLSVGPDKKISNASGFLAKFVATAEYDLVGAKTATLRSQDAKWSNLGPQEQYKNGGYPMPLAYAKDSTVASGDIAVAQPSEPSVPANGAGQPILDAGLDPQSITSATTAYLQWWLSDGSTILLPAYKLVADQGTSSIEDDRTWLQIAITDKYVDFS